MWRMMRVIVLLAWNYAVSLGPFVAVVLIIAGVAMGRPLLRYSGALVLGATGAVLLSCFVRGLAGGGSAWRVLRSPRSFGVGRVLLVGTGSALLALAAGVAGWAGVMMVLEAAR